MVKSLLPPEARAAFDSTFVKATDPEAKDTETVSLVDTMMTIMSDNKLAKQVRIPPRGVAVHPDNRDKKKMPLWQ